MSITHFFDNGDTTFGVADIVNKLRELRIASLEERQRQNRPPKLPSRRALKEVVDNLAQVLFPNRLGHDAFTPEGIDLFVGYTLDITLRELHKQVSWELLFKSSLEALTPELQHLATNLVKAFASQLPTLRVFLDTDIQAAYEGDPAAGSIDEVLVCYPGVYALIYHRIAHILYCLGAVLTARVISEIAHSATGIDIHPGAKIGQFFFIDHGTGVVIGETAEIGNHVRVYQAVTLGAKRFPIHADGTLVKGNPRHPIVEDNVVIYAGATILGRITIGHDSVIGGNVWVVDSVPPGSTVTQQQVNRENKHVSRSS